jgi:hypothetical protein
MNVDEFLGQTGNWSGPASVDEKHNRLAGCTPTADDQGDDWRALQPIWNLFLAHSRYAAAPWFPIVIANFFFFVCIIPYAILDFYGLDHWAWVRRLVYVEFPLTFMHNEP